MTTFRPPPSDGDFRALEAAVVDRWERHRVFERSVAERAGAPEFVFFEGPPTANGRPGIHHVWARVYKDLFCRFQTMRGHRVRRRAGWDTHGLPVEVEVEKALGFTGKHQIEEFGVAAFVDRCRASVRAYVEDWERLTRRIGFWVDTEDAYWTMTSDYVQSVWWHLRQLWDDGLLFEDVKVVPYCPRCGTALSSHELGQPDVYRDVEDTSAYVRLPITSGGPTDARWLVVWTTTPWTLVSNTGVAVHPDLAYVVVDGAVVAEARADAVLGEGAAARASQRLTGAELVGTRYARPLDAVAAPEGADGWRVVAAPFVTAGDGSGLVHLAPAFGADDWLVGRAERLPTLNPVGPDGRFTADAGARLEGRAVTEANADILGWLDRDGLLVAAAPHVHSYPHCWRCSTPLLYWGKPSWYVATSARKDDLVAANESVTWRPEHVKHGRFGEWLANNVDWALSRDRYWGTPLPVWRCPDGHARCVASLGELSELAGRDVTTVDPHRPTIDEVTFPCPDCGAPSARVEAVIDAWFDSGAMPAARWGYPHRPGSADDFRVPADFVAEGIDQTRGWFYSLLAVNLLVHGEVPYRHVLALGLIVDGNGRKMSKSLGNIVDPWEVLDTRGADPLRWWMFHQGSPWTATRTSLPAIDASTADVLMTVWNTWAFFATYATLNRFEPGDRAVPPPAARPALDRWARSRVHATVGAVTEALEDYRPFHAATAIGELVDDLSNWYVRRSRRRFWRTDPAADDADALAAHATLHEALTTVSLLLAPFCPFVAEQLWTAVTGAADEDSVHLAPWPAADETAVDAALERAMAQARRLVSLGRTARSQAGVKVRQPLRRAVVVVPAGDRDELLADVVADELNVDEVVVSDVVGDLLSVELAPNFRLLGPRLGDAVREVRDALAGLDAHAARDRFQRGEPVVADLSVGPVELRPDEVDVRVRPRPGYAVATEGVEAVALDVELDDELRRRGLLRDVVRHVQELRRAAGLAVDDRIELRLSGVDELAPDAATIARDVLAVNVAFEAAQPPEDGWARVAVDAGPGRVATAWLRRAP